MAKKGDIYLGPAGIEQLVSPFGRKLHIGDIQIAREDRTASGRLVRDITATKKKITLAYETIDGDALAMFLALYDLQEELSILIYKGNEQTIIPNTWGPVNGALDLPINPVLTCPIIPAAAYYWFMIGTTPDVFSGIVFSGFEPSSIIKVFPPLENNTTYYWTCLALDSGFTLIGYWSSPFSFKTIALTTTEEAEYDAYTVLMEPIDRERLLLVGEGLWSGVNIVLNEV